MDFELKAMDPSENEKLSQENLEKMIEEKLLKERKESETGISSDTDSWEILDEDQMSLDESKQEELQTSPQIEVEEEQVILNEGTKKIPFLPLLDDCDQESLPSVLSDGIPIAEDLSEGKPQYLWNEDIDHDHEVEEATEAITLNDNNDNNDSNALEELDVQNGENDVMSSSSGSLDSDRSERTRIFLGRQDEMNMFPLLRENKQNDSDYLEEKEETDEESDLDEDIEIISPAMVHRDSDITTKYPSEELPEDFAEATIQRGRTYSHHRNQQVNVTLTAVVIVVVSMVVGLGVGHFLGWSERLELQEQFAEVREEKLENLAESLVNCMTGEEGKGGDDQDLDDRVIKQLWAENKELKDELQLLQSYRDESAARKIENELNAILRDRVNDLMSANADLEREVAKLRYAHSAIKEKEESIVRLEQTSSDLFQAKESLNEIANENDQLKIAVVKARYSAPAAVEVSVDEKLQINELRTENDELRREIRKVRYLPLPYKDPASPMFENIDKSLDETLESDSSTNPDNQMFDEFSSSKNELNSISSENSAFPESLALDSNAEQSLDVAFQLPVDLPEPKKIYPDLELPESSFEVGLPFAPVTIKKEEEKKSKETLKDFTSTIEKIFNELPFALPKEKESKTEDFALTLDNLFNEFMNQEEKVNENLKSESGKGNFFSKLSEILSNTTGFLLEETPLHMMRMIEGINKKARKFLKDDIGYEKSSFAESVEKILLEKWKEIEKFSAENENSFATRKAVEKLTKTFKETLEVFKDSLKSENFDQAWDKIQFYVQNKWQNILNKFQSVKADEKKKEKSETSDWTFSYGKVNNNNNNDTKWMFSRAEKRKESRKESEKSDWLFERANYRKRFHKMNAADWHSKRFFNRKCSVMEDKCETIGDLNEAEMNRIHKKKQKTIDMNDKKNMRNKKGETFEEKKEKYKIIEFEDEEDFEEEFESFIGGGREFHPRNDDNNYHGKRWSSSFKARYHQDPPKYPSRKNSRYRYNF